MKSEVEVKKLLDAGETILKEAPDSSSIYHYMRGFVEALKYVLR